MSVLNNIVLSPENYAKSSALAKEVGKEMLARLDWVTLKPRKILDVGCGTGAMTALLKTRYPDSEVIGIDKNEAMIAYAKQDCKQAITWLEGDASQLSFQDQSIDLIYANLLLPVYADFQSLLTEWRRVLRPDGLLILTTLGPDTFHDLRDGLDENAMPYFIDLHDLGDALQTHGFADPVVDVNGYTLHYSNREAAIRELIQTSMYWSDPPEDFFSSEVSKALFPVSYEVVFAHAFAPSPKPGFSASEDGLVRIPVSHLLRVDSK